MQFVIGSINDPRAVLGESDRIANIYTQIGLLALIGSIIHHGVLLVEFANQILEEKSCDRREAMQKAASLRFRSIVMTTVATLILVVPLLRPGCQQPLRDQLRARSTC